MKIKSLLVGAFIASASVSIAQNNILSSSPEGYFSRGVLMYNDSNYEGAIDQLKHLLDMPTKPQMQEEANFYLAMSMYESGDENAISLLTSFISDYPSSVHIPEVWYTIGNKYFFANKYGEALVAYRNIYNGGLSGDNALECSYRKGYSNLKLANYDEAKTLFKYLGYYPKYKETSIFYLAYIDYTQGDYEDALSGFRKVNRKTDLGYNAQYYMAQIYFHRNEYEKVVSMGNSLLKENRNSEFNSELYRIIGESEYHLGDNDLALTNLKKYLSSIDETPQRSALYILGVLEYKLGNYDNALDYLNGVTSEDDALAQSAYLYAGQAYVKENNYSAASIAFEKALKMPFDRAVQETAFYNYAIAQNTGARTPFSKSIDIFEEFLNKYQDSKYATDVEEYLINAYINGNDYNKALESISHITKPSQKVLKAKQYVLYNLGVDALSNNRASAAIDLFKKGLALGALNPSIYNDCNLWLGEALYRKGEYASAKKYLQTFINNTNVNNPNYSLGLYLLGYTQFQQREYSVAENTLQKIFSYNSSLSSDMKGDALTRIADCQYYNKQYSQAEATYNRALEFNPNATDYVLFQKAIMAGLIKQYSNKISILDDLISKYPNSHYAPNGMLEKGLAQIALTNYNGAISTFERLLTKYPKTTEARKGLLQLAITEKTIGTESKAIANYKKVITLYPSSEEASLAAEDLKLIYADLNQMDELATFLDSTPNAPKIEVAELDQLTFLAAEKAMLADNGSIDKIKNYVKRFPNGAFVATAKFYIAKDDFKNGKYESAMKNIENLMETAGDASFAEDVLAMKGAILAKQGHATDALITYKELAKVATINENRIQGYLGAIRAAKELNRHNDVVENANSLLGLQGVTDAEEKEATFARAGANSSLHKYNDAVTDWKKLAADTRNEYGAQSSYLLANYYFEKGNLKDAEKVLNKFIDSGTPHHYWLAKGFILLSDVYMKNGKSFEAREYLESLKSNYPGKESEIFNMIDDRLESMKK